MKWTNWHLLHLSLLVEYSGLQCSLPLWNHDCDPIHDILKIVEITSNAPSHSLHSHEVLVCLLNFYAFISVVFQERVKVIFVFKFPPSPSKTWNYCTVCHQCMHCSVFNQYPSFGHIFLFFFNIITIWLFNLEGRGWR